MPFPKNCPQLQDLPDLPPQEIAALPADVLAILQHESEAALKQAKAAKSRLDGASGAEVRRRRLPRRGASPARTPAPSASMTATSP